jgi:hypothetical protein
MPKNERSQFMNINVSIIEKAVDKVVKDILEQLNGELNPSLTSQEAINKLGAVSGLILHLRDEAREAGLSGDLLDRIWMLKKDSDDNLESLLNEPKIPSSVQKNVSRWFEEEVEKREQERLKREKENMKLYQRRE